MREILVEEQPHVGGMTTDEILADFPDLTAEDIRACLAFAADRERRLWVIPAA